MQAAKIMAHRRKQREFEQKKAKVTKGKWNSRSGMVFRQLPVWVYNCWIGLVFDPLIQEKPRSQGDDFPGAAFSLFFLCRCPV